ncbi:MAG: hypothetical protein ABIO36_02135 [Pyrinomonadaceae bacterium]
MFLKIIALASLLGVFAATFAASAPARSDTIKGEWAGVFSIAGHTADVALQFVVDGKNVTGTVSSEHTGPGTITDGKWEDGKLTCTLKFEKHESIKFWGGLKDGKLSGEFATEGMTGTWAATKKP